MGVQEGLGVRYNDGVDWLMTRSHVFPVWEPWARINSRSSGMRSIERVVSLGASIEALWLCVMHLQGASFVSQARCAIEGSTVKFTFRQELPNSRVISLTREIDMELDTLHPATTIPAQASD